jgi:hypothetical protein
MTARVLGRSAMVSYFDELHFVDEVVAADKLAKQLAPDEEIAAWRELNRRYAIGILQARRQKGRLQKDGPEEDVQVAGRTGAQLLLHFMASKSGRDVKYVCEQTPRNLAVLGPLLSALPRTRVVALVRDPRDVLLSQRTRWRRRRLGSDRHTSIELLRNWANYQPLLLAIMWKRDSLRIAAAERDSRVTVLRFEDLVRDSTESLNQLCDHLDLPRDPSMLHVPHLGSSTAADSESVGIRTDASGRWQASLSRREIWIIERVCASEMQSRGYAPSNVRPSLVGGVALGVESLSRAVLLLPLNWHLVRPVLRRVRTLAPRLWTKG